MGVLIFIVLPVVSAWLVHTGCVAEVLVLILFLFYDTDTLGNRIEIFLMVSTFTILYLSILRMSLPLMWLFLGVWAITTKFSD